MNMKKLKKMMPDWLKDPFKNIRAYIAPPAEIRKSKQAIKPYRNTYKGKRCFVIGNGPSLTSEDLEKLKGEITFASNRIYHMYDKTAWRPTFYCVQDTEVAQQMGDGIVWGGEESKATFIRLETYRRISEIYKKIKNAILVPIWITDANSEGKIKFSVRADKHIHDGYNVTYMAMELAAYMGITEIYLLGVDFSFPVTMDKDGNVIKVDKSIVAHFYQTAEDNNVMFIATNREKTLAYYIAAERYSRESGKFRIYNATRGGKLEVFERVDFDSLFSPKIMNR